MNPDRTSLHRQAENMIAVASAKGGVGKSTTAVNLALALAVEGSKVGLLDADIHGPNQGTMLGIKAGRHPDIVSREKSFIPLRKYGISVMSMNFLTANETPMIWRGPMVSGAVQQMANQTQWGELDYLVVDMPPGTGDIHLTICQKMPLSGAVIVTTPQNIARMDTRKAIEMFRKVNVPILGIIENMSFYNCPKCGHENQLFSQGAGLQLATEYDVPLLGKLPMDPQIGMDIERGKPSVASEPDSDVSRIYRDIARYLAAVPARYPTENASEKLIISIDDD